MSITLQEPVNMDEVIALVQRLTDDDKIRFGIALKQEMIDNTLEKLLVAFRTDELDMETITREVESVREDRFKPIQALVHGEMGEVSSQKVILEQLIGRKRK